MFEMGTEGRTALNVLTEVKEGEESQLIERRVRQLLDELYTMGGRAVVHRRRGQDLQGR
jgi:hypothetical protein